MKPVLVTGFEPFAGAADNPSAQLAQRLDGSRLADGRPLRGLVLPVSYAQAPRVLDAWLARETPAGVLALGLAMRRRRLSLERVAHNRADAARPDNDGVQPPAGPLDPHGPPTRVATLPLEAMVRALRAAGHPAGLSPSAGGYVCNALYYALLGRCEALGVPAAFVHVPPVAAWPLDAQLDAVRLALDTAYASSRSP